MRCDLVIKPIRKSFFGAIPPFGFVLLVVFLTPSATLPYLSAVDHQRTSRIRSSA